MDIECIGCDGTGIASQWMVDTARDHDGRCDCCRGDGHQRCECGARAVIAVKQPGYHDYLCASCLAQVAAEEAIGRVAAVVRGAA